MKVTFLIPSFLLLTSIVLAQTPIKDLTPTGEEIQTLAKLKERILKNRAELDSLQVKEYALGRDIILKQQEINNAISNLNNAATNIKEAHKKEWGDPKNVDYNATTPPDQNPLFEGGVFSLINKDTTTKEDKKDGSEETKKVDESKKGGQKEEKVLKPKVANKKPKR